MIRILAVLALLSLILGTTAPESLALAPRKAIMVVDFVDRTGTWPNTRDVVTTRLIGKLRDDQSIRVVPRERVQEALQQAKMETAGIIDWEDAQKIAKAFEADYVIMGEVTVFNQQKTGGCVPVVGCVYTDTASVALHGKILKVATGKFVAEPTAEAKAQSSSGSTSAVPQLGNVTLDNVDSQLIGKAVLEAAEKFVSAAKPKLN
jgi:curli biogenesis system outer membrane secretion channel CsgG